eukprot:1747186-Rhodomonas_salina.1
MRPHSKSAVYCARRMEVRSACFASTWADLMGHVGRTLGALLAAYLGQYRASRSTRLGCCLGAYARSVRASRSTRVHSSAAYT